MGLFIISAEGAERRDPYEQGDDRLFLQEFSTKSEGKNLDTKLGKDGWPNNQRPLPRVHSCAVCTIESVCSRSATLIGVN